jgi:hypothetical protein
MLMSLACSQRVTKGEIMEEVTFFEQVLQFIKSMGGVDVYTNISAAILLVVASSKVPFVKQVFWDKLGKFKALLPLVLGLIAGLVVMGKALTLPAAFVYISTGAGAIAMHEILKAVKELPGIAPVWVKVLDVVGALLGKKANG